MSACDGVKLLWIANTTAPTASPDMTDASGRSAIIASFLGFERRRGRTERVGRTGRAGDDDDVMRGARGQAGHVVAGGLRRAVALAVHEPGVGMGALDRAGEGEMRSRAADVRHLR